MRTTEHKPRILMIAYHFPPLQGSSGIHRTLCFSRHLAAAGWEVNVLTVTRNAYEAFTEANERMVPAGVRVIRAPALDTTRQLSVHGKYPGFLAIPDRWVSWVAPAVIAGLYEAVRHRPAFLYSTYPIASAHIIGYLLHRLTNIPWIADFRDPMAQDNYPEDPRVRSAFLTLEARIFRHAVRVLFTTRGAADYYRHRYPESAGKSVVIENGYDELMFDDVERSLPRAPEKPGTPLKLLHSGVLYPHERDPSQFFSALRTLKAEGTLTADVARIVLRGAGHESYFLPLIEAAGLDDIVSVEPSIGYREAVAEMFEADAFLLFQASGCNFQVPAKLYEYLRCGKPILALTDPAGDTAGVLRRAHADWIAEIGSAESIASMLRTVIPALQASSVPRVAPEFVAACARSARARELTALLNELLHEPR